MTEPVRRGGRGSQALAADEAAEREERRKVEERLLNDVRTLQQHPAFLRYVKHWIGVTGAFAVAEVYSAEVYALNAKKAIGLAMWNQMMAADKTKVLDLIELTMDPSEDSHD